jgi:prepilin peptidase dependent protein A
VQKRTLFGIDADGNGNAPFLLPIFPYTRRMKIRLAEGEQGMTLIEVMIVLALVASMSLWSLHGWREYQQQLQLEQQAQRLRLYLTGLQSIAYSHNQTQLLWVIDGLSGCVGAGKRPASCLVAEDRYFQTTAPNISVRAYSEKIMGFYGLRNMAQGGHINVSNAAGTLRVVLSARGRLRLCSFGKPMSGFPKC